MQTHTIDAAQAAAAMAPPELTSVGSNTRHAKGDACRLKLIFGRDKEQDAFAAEVLTTSQTVEDERSMLEAAGCLMKAADKISKHGEGLDTAQLQRLGTNLSFSDEQTLALTHVVNGCGKLAVVKGFA
ncbi:MAG: hypothetical protein EOO38_04160, partial [Cytophagaceae bacterium]